VKRRGKAGAGGEGYIDYPFFEEVKA